MREIRGSISGLGRHPGEGNDNPLQYSCLGKSHGQRSLVGYSPWGCTVRHEWMTNTRLLKLKTILSPWKCPKQLAFHIQMRMGSTTNPCLKPIPQSLSHENLCSIIPQHLSLQADSCTPIVVGMWLRVDLHFCTFGVELASLVHSVWEKWGADITGI